MKSHLIRWGIEAAHHPSVWGKDTPYRALSFYAEKTLKDEYVFMSTTNIKFHRAEEALRYITAAKDQEESIGSASCRTAADSELGLTPDCDTFGPDSTDKINARIDIEQTITMNWNWRYREVLDIFLSAECVRMYPRA